MANYVGVTPNNRDVLLDISKKLSKAQATDIEGGGIITVGTTPIELTFSGTTETISIIAHIDNPGVLYIGESNVTSAGANAAYTLWAGTPFSIDYDDVTNPLYIVASVADQKFIKGATL